MEKENNSFFSVFRSKLSKPVTNPLPALTKSCSTSINGDDEDLDEHEEGPKSSFFGETSLVSTTLHRSFIAEGMQTIKDEEDWDTPKALFYDGTSSLAPIPHQSLFNCHEEPKKDDDLPELTCYSRARVKTHRTFLTKDQVDEETSGSSDDCLGSINNEPGEILKLADMEDALKAFRIVQMRKLSMLNNQMQSIAEESPEHQINPENRESIEKETSTTEDNGSVKSSEILCKQENPNSKVDSSPVSSLSDDISQKASLVEEIPSLQSNQTNVEERPAVASFKSLIQKSIKTVYNKEQDHELPVMEGFLEKRGLNFLHMWQKRYVTLRDKKLLYYKSEEDMDQPIGCLDFDLFLAKIEVDATDPKKFTIVPVGSNTAFIFKANNEEERSKWIVALKAHINASEGAKCKLNSIAPKRNFWKHARISEAKFLMESRTGDLLLFRKIIRTQNFAAILQRSVTRSEYDHVGVILKDQDNNIVLFEATGNEGVGLCRWSTFKKYNWHALYKK